MPTRLLCVLSFSLLSACAGLDGGRGIPAPVEDRTGQAVQGQPASPPAPAGVPARTHPARSVVPGIDDLPPREPAPVTPGTASPLPVPAPQPAVPSTPSSALLTDVDQAIAAGDLERAAAVAERALRIAPRDPQLWYRLASIRARQERNEEAEGFARRALSFATTDAALTSEITRFLGTLER